MNPIAWTPTHSCTLMLEKWVSKASGVQGFKELGPCSLVPGFSPGFSFGIEWGVGVPGFCLEHRQQVVDENCFVHGAVDSVKNRCCAVSASLKSLPKSWCP